MFPDPDSPQQPDAREFERLFYGFAHDIKQVLFKMTTAGEMLAERLSQDDAAKGYLQRLADGGQGGRELIEEMARYVALLKPLETTEPVPVDELVREALADLVPASRPSAETKVPPSVRIRGDRGQLKQALQHLLSNAVKYRQKDAEPRVTIEARAEEAEGRVRILVADNGIGFDEKYSQKIFEPFQKLFSKKEYPGPGLGLSVVQKVVQNHGGRVTVTSRVGEGSCFVMEFPNAA